MHRGEISYNKVSQTMNVFCKNGIDRGTCMHTHQSWIFGMVLNGERTLHINGENVTVRANQYYVIPPNCPHRLLSGNAETQSVVISIQNAVPPATPVLNKNISREYRIRKTKATYGLPPAKLERQNRLRHAAELLQQGFSQAYIAAETGFFDQAHLCRCFKALWGITLQELKNAERTNDNSTFPTSTNRQTPPQSFNL